MTQAPKVLMTKKTNYLRNLGNHRSYQIGHLCRKLSSFFLY